MKDVSHSGRSDDVRRLAHTLKSRSLMLGADPLAGLLRKMEVVSQGSGSGKAIRFLPEIEGECERVAQAPLNPLESETLHA